MSCVVRWTETVTDDSTDSCDDHIEVTPASSESAEDGAASVESAEVVTHLSTTDTSVTLQIEPNDEKAAAVKKRKKISKELIICRLHQVNNASDY